MTTTSPARTAASYIWALSPLYTLGYAAPLTLGFGAARRRSIGLWAATFLYLVLVTAMLMTADSENGSSADTVFVITWIPSWLGGTLHALAIRHRVFGLATRPDSLERAEQKTRHRRDLRARAAALARDDPQTALEMGIGRPDLPRTFDDGGIVDINHAPASAIMTVPGITREQAEQIVRLRQDVHAFTSAEEVSAMADLPPHLTPTLAEHTVYLT
ncbi:ComEA family DNA-binding protein [Actinomadura chokoriensis]|uniref:ComEA family DNA-binding protein n=1 Tax=Actinomadura chokoriensis TaxID=454156 RepID=UPI0031F9E0AC